jgi:hypothetical protein
VVKTAEAGERLIIAKQVDDARMLLAGGWDHYEQLPAGPQSGQTGFKVGTEHAQLCICQKPVVESRFGEAAQ